MAEENEYERLRAAKIAENKAKLAQLGLIEASRALMSTAQGPGVTLEAGAEAQPRKKRRVAKEPAPELLVPSRQSSRIRGEAAPSTQQAAAVAQREAAEEEEEGLGRTKKGTSRRRLTLDEGIAYAAPFTLWSIGVTVWELGQVHRGAWAHRYWSSSGCLFHHAYPVGYRASKVQFGRTYEMSIEAGPTGPVFKVTDQKTGVSFSGESPTKPWTDVCIAHRTGQRISGPLFFGFSDLATQRAIAGLYSPQELQAALQGERVESAAASAEEKAAREFQGVEGIGEATAMALAYTKALGGAQHASLASLQDWVRQSEANQQQLREWLTGSSELPETTRKWPAWRFRMVPKIVAALSGAAPAAAAPAADRGKANGRANRSEAGGSRQRQHQQQGGEGAGGDAAEGGAGQPGIAAAASRAKENVPGNSARTAGSSKAAATAAAAAAAPRASARQRKASSRYAGQDFLVELAE